MWANWPAKRMKTYVKISLREMQSYVLLSNMGLSADEHNNFRSNCTTAIQQNVTNSNKSNGCLSKREWFVHSSTYHSYWVKENEKRYHFWLDIFFVERFHSRILWTVIIIFELKNSITFQIVWVRLEETELVSLRTGRYCMKKKSACRTDKSSEEWRNSNEALINCIGQQ